MKGKNIHFGDPGALDILYRVTGGETGPVRLGQAQGGPGMPGALPHASSEGAFSYLEGDSPFCRAMP